MELLKNPNFDFLGKTRICVPLSLAVVAGSIALMASEGGLRYGVEFSGGSQLIVKFTSSPEIDRVRSAVESVSPGAVIQTFDDPAKNRRRRVARSLAHGRTVRWRPLLKATPRTRHSSLPPRSSDRSSAPSCGGRPSSSRCSRCSSS